MDDQGSSQPLVSVIIASYNHQNYIEESILSVLQQSYKNIELTVVDDGSTDDSVELIQALADEHDFEFKSQANSGLSATLNKVLAKARGQYFVPFGSDDIMMPDRIQKQVAYMEANPYLGLCGGNILRMDAKGETLKKQKNSPGAELDFQDVLLDNKPGLPAPTLFFRKSVLDEVGGFDPTIRLEDLYIQLSIARKGYKLGFLSDILSYYRVHPKNTYKDLRFMHDNVLETYARFSDDPSYDVVKKRFLNSLLLKAASTDKKYGWQVLKEIPFKAFNLKTIRGIIKLISP